MISDWDKILRNARLGQLSSDKSYVPPSGVFFSPKTNFYPALLTATERPKPDIKSHLTKKFNPSLCIQLKARLKQKTLVLKRIREITNGLTMPEIAEVPIGSAKKMTAAVLFFDLKDFTLRAATLGNEKTLFVLNHIIPIMIYIVKRWNGEIEKNTGDGIMAIFGTETRNNFIIARDAIEAAMTMRYAMQELVSPILQENEIGNFSFRIGIDMGELLIAKIGLEKNNFLTVVGWPANAASKLQGLALVDGICIGNNLKDNLSTLLHKYCKERTEKGWNYIYRGTQTPYKMFDYTVSWPDPAQWVKI